MKTILGSLWHTVFTGNKTQILWCWGLLIIILVLAVLHHKWRDEYKKLTIWRLLCLIPLIYCGVHFFLNVSGAILFFSEYIPLYAIGVLTIIPLLFARRPIGYRIAAVPVGLLTILCGAYFTCASPNFFNHTKESYSESFHSLCEDMEKTYILKEWKEVDFKALEDKYMPKVKEAEILNDPTKFAIVVRDFTNELHDSHVNIQVKPANFEEFRSQITKDKHDYGLSMVKLDSGEVIAVCTSEEVNKLGIQDGTVITEWGGYPIDEAPSHYVPDQGYPVKANEDIMSIMYLSTRGGDTVMVSFLDDEGTEQTVHLKDLGEIKSMTKAVALFSHETEYKSEEEYLEANFSTKMLDNKCGYIQVLGEGTENGIHDTLGYLMGDHKWARDMFREKLNDLKSQGMEYLVIDLRNNGGGLDEIGCALTDLFTDEEYFGQGLGIRQDGKYKCVSEHGIHGTGEFKDLKVVALTNFNCASAGDGTSLYLSRLPNVTLAGITDPNGCNQETGGMCALSDGIVIVNYPTGLVLNEDGEPNVDTKADRISRNPVEERIPLDYDAAMKIFKDEQDYELDWAVEYLENGE